MKREKNTSQITTELVLSRLYAKIIALLFLMPTSDFIRGDAITLEDVRLESF